MIRHQPAQVGSGTKDRSGTGQNDAPHLSVLCELFEDIVELIDHALIESIPSVRPVQHDAGHAIS